MWRALSAVWYGTVLAAAVHSLSYLLDTKKPRCNTCPGARRGIMGLIAPSAHGPFCLVAVFPSKLMSETFDMRRLGCGGPLLPYGRLGHSRGRFRKGVGPRLATVAGGRRH